MSAPVEKGIYELLTQDAGVLAVVETQPDNSPCVFWVLQTKGTKYPSVVITRATTRDVYSLSGSSNLRFASFQFDCYGNTYYDARAMADAVRDLLKSFSGTLPDSAGSPPDGTVVQGCVVTRDMDFPFEPGSKSFIYRSMLEVTIAYEG